MTMLLTTSGRHFDFLASIAGAGLTPSQINIIESNLQTQVNVKVGYTKITWVDGLPSVIEKYEDKTMTNKLYTITLAFLGGIIDNVVVVNEDDAITETIYMTFVDGLLTEVEKL